VIQTSERYADGLAGPRELQAAAERTRAWLVGAHLAAGAWVATPDVWEAVSWEADVNGRRVAAGWHTGHLPESPPDAEQFSARLAQEQGWQCHLLRDIFASLPFRLLPPLERPIRTWNGGIIVKLATAIYEERSLPEGTLDPHRLAVLADALEEAGVTDPHLLGHLRQPAAVHVRGCWCVDLLLGKS
jgi:hypothetical protein